MEKQSIKHTDDFLTSFSKVNKNLIATNDQAWSSSWVRSYTTPTRDYSLESIKKIIESGSLEEQRRLSRNYFYKDGIYKKLILYYATLLDYAGLLIPQPGYGKDLSTPHIAKRYHQAGNFINNIPLRNIFTGFSQRMLVDGSYFGVSQNIDKNNFSIIDLPSNYCATNYKDEKGNDIIEFDLSYFNTITDENKRKQVLKIYPKVISHAWNQYSKGKRDKWFLIPSDIGICFPLFDNKPMFLSAIGACVEYDNAVGVEQDRALEEIRKVLVQKVPHLSDGSLLFEPDEAEVMHSGAVGMLKGNKNISVLTTYADVDAITSKTSADSNNNTLERMYKNIYNNAGVSSEIFCSTGSATMAASIKMDISLMMVFANRYAYFMTQVVNRLFANSNISFKYTIFPICEQNRKDFIDESFKLAQSGYSFLLPALAMGFTQQDVGNIKDLENSVLDLGTKMVPLSSAYTQSGSGDVGAPKKAEDEKAPQTLANDASANNTGSDR